MKLPGFAYHRIHSSERNKNDRFWFPLQTAYPLILLALWLGAMAFPASAEEPKPSDLSLKLAKHRAPAVLQAMIYSQKQDVITIAITRNPDLPYSHEQITAKYRQHLIEAAQKYPEALAAAQKVKFFTEDDPEVEQGEVRFFYRTTFGKYSLVQGTKMLDKLVEGYLLWQQMDEWGGPNPPE